MSHPHHPATSHASRQAKKRRPTIDLLEEAAQSMVTNSPRADALVRAVVAMQHLCVAARELGLLEWPYVSVDADMQILEQHVDDLAGYHPLFAAAAEVCNIRNIPFGTLVQ